MIVVIVSMAGACEKPMEQAIDHPQVHRLIGAALAPVVLDSLPDGGSDSLAKLHVITGQLDAAVGINRVNGDTGEPFGTIADAVVTRDRTVLILDHVFGMVREFNIGGQPIGSVGNMGLGPGEFARPHAMTLVSDTVLVVGDEQGLLHRFNKTGSEWSFDAAAGGEGVILDSCGDQENLFFSVVSDDDATTVRALRHSDGTVRPIAQIYESDNPIVRQFTTDALLACHPDGNQVFVLPRYLDRVIALSLSGQVLWVAQIPRHHSFTIREISSETVLTGVPEYQDSLHVGATLNFVDDFGLVAQWEVLSRRDGFGTPLGYDTYLLDPDGGEGSFAGRYTNKLHHVGGDLAVIGTESPVPAVAVRSMIDDGTEKGPR